MQKHLLLLLGLAQATAPKALTINFSPSTHCAANECIIIVSTDFSQAISNFHLIQDNPAVSQINRNCTPKQCLVMLRITRQNKLLLRFRFIYHHHWQQINYTYHLPSYYAS